jgi:uncharacterized Zn finger protein (UPF0148 family)
LAETDRKKLKSVSDLIRLGGKLLAESCPKCGGVQVQYRGRTLCANCDDLNLVEKIRATAPTDVSSRLKSLISTKIDEAAKRLEGEEDPERQEKLTEVILKYLEILDKVEKQGKESGSKEGNSRSG